MHFEAPIDLNKNGISGLKEVTKNGDAVNLKQLNDILITNTEILKVTFFTFRPKYDNYSETSSFKKFSFSNLLFFESEEKYFNSNADSLTFKKSGVCYFYYADKIISIDRGNLTKGYLEAFNSTNPFHKNNIQILLKLKVKYNK